MPVLKETRSQTDAASFREQQSDKAAPGQHVVSVPLTTKDHDNLSRHINKFLDIYEKLEPVNSADVKPNYSYTELLMMAILRSPNYCRPINEVYEFIREKFAFFRHTKKGFWKNAVRHSLSKTRCFRKLGIMRPSSKAGLLSRPVCLWTLVPECLIKFARGDYRVGLDHNGANNLSCAFKQAKAEAFWTNVSKMFASVLDAVGKSMAQVEVPLTHAQPLHSSPVHGVPRKPHFDWTEAVPRDSKDVKRITPTAGKKRSREEPEILTESAPPIYQVITPKSGPNTMCYDQNRPLTVGLTNASHATYVTTYEKPVASSYPYVYENSNSYGFQHQVYNNYVPNSPAYTYGPPEAKRARQDNYLEQTTGRVTPPMSCLRSTSPNTSVDVTNLCNTSATSFSDSFRSVDNEDRKPYVEIESAHFTTDFSSAPKIDTHQQSRQLLEFLAQGGLNVYSNS